MPESIDDYMHRLTEALRQRGIDDPRIVAEAREHLLDAVTDGRRRGLSVEDAEREAFDRFGAPEIVAAHAVFETHRPMLRFVAALQTIWQRKWWILAPTVVTALLTSVASAYLLPTRYQSESVIHLTRLRVPGDFAPSGLVDSPTHERFQELTQLILSSTRLEQIITDFGLYGNSRGNTPDADLVTQLREDLALSLLASDEPQSGDMRGFRVSFVGADPGTAMRVTARIAALFVEENARDQGVLIQGVSHLIESQILDMRARIVDYENRLEQLRAQNGGRPLSRADLLPYEVLQESYKTLLIKAEQARMTETLRRQIGMQVRIIEPARLPQRPVGPSRMSVNLAGAFAGLGVGLATIGMRGRSKRSLA